MKNATFFSGDDSEIIIFDYQTLNGKSNNIALSFLKKDTLSSNLSVRLKDGVEVQCEGSCDCGLKWDMKKGTLECTCNPCSMTIE